MKTFNILILMSIVLNSCITTKIKNANLISLEEANRIIYKTIMLSNIKPDKWSGNIYFVDYDDNFGNNLINTNKKKLSLKDFDYFKNEKSVSIISNTRAKNDENIRIYHSISLFKFNKEFCIVRIFDYFKGPPGTKFVNESTTAHFKFKIDNGKCKLIRYRFN